MANARVQMNATCRNCASHLPVTMSPTFIIRSNVSIACLKSTAVNSSNLSPRIVRKAAKGLFLTPACPSSAAPNQWITLKYDLELGLRKSMRHGVFASVDDAFATMHLTNRNGLELARIRACVAYGLTFLTLQQPRAVRSHFQNHAVFENR